ncbi:type II toxin-antitoxin system RelE family toxin [Sulfurimonas sp. NWX367]|uniref:type II toxin-antitoxin system RelE family toxin n=1 Tax=unclassified Sulfurimonas TaxID=2623549 RepID=UPI00320493D9
MYKIIYHPLVEEDLKKLNNSVRIEVFKKLEKIKVSPELGPLLGNKNNLNLSGLRKVYVAKKQVRIVYEIVDDILVVKVIAIGKREGMKVYTEAQKRRE